MACLSGNVLYVHIVIYMYIGCATGSIQLLTIS